MKLTGNTVLITGGGGDGGFGLALAEAFLLRGNEVILCARDTEHLEAVQRRHPALHVKRSDLSDVAGCQELALWVADRFEMLNVLVNQAAIRHDIDFTRGADDLLCEPSEVRINLEAPMLLCALAVPLMTGQHPAAVINITSELAFVPAARMPVYSATQAGLHAFTMALRHQLAPIGIQVFEVLPPAFPSTSKRNGGTHRAPAQFEIEPAEFAEVVMADLESDIPEIGYGSSADVLRASRAEIDRRFAQLNDLR